MGTRQKKIKDHYAVLQVHPRADADVIKAAYRVLEGQCSVGSAEAIALAEAFDALTDQDKRETYDEDRLATPSGEKLIGPYRVVEKIGKGGFGPTYKAMHVLTEMPVCIKHCSKISPSGDDILIKEAQAMWDLRHFGIATVRDLIRLEDTRLALVMSYIPGRTLAQLIEKHPRLDPEHMAWILERLLSTLRFMHLHGVVHGDVKPQNIIVQDDSHTVVLVDFGIAANRPTCRSGNKGYTDLYAPPEQHDPANPLLPETDLYSLGKTMVFALAGGDLERVKNREVPMPRTPEPLADFLRRLMVTETLDRPNWGKEDLIETITRVRQESFGRTSTFRKPLPD